MTIEKISQDLFQWLHDAGADGDLVVSDVRSLSLKALDGALDEHSVNSGRTLGLRVVKDNQVGTAYSEATDEDSLRFMLDQALTNARFSEPHPEEQIRSVAQTFSDDGARINPQDDTPIEARIDFLIELEAKLLSYDNIRNVPYNGLSDAIRQQSVFSSKGCSASMTTRQQIAYAMPLAAEGENTAMNFALQAGRHFNDLDLQSLIQNAYRNSTSLLDGKPIPTGHYDVVFDHNVQAQLLSAFSSMWSGKWAQDGINPYRDKIGERVFDKRLSFVDRPLNVEGLGYQVFDDEGMATVDTTLVTEGELKTLAHNTATAHHFGVETTGHASRGAKSALNVGLHQLHLLAGPDGADTMTQGSWLKVTKLDGLHSGTNPISGEFSCGASGFLYRDGECVQTVRGVTVAGNLYRMLDNIAGVSDKMLWNDYKSSCMASIRFADLAVSG